MPVKGCTADCPLHGLELELEPLPFEPEYDGPSQAEAAKTLYEPLEDWQIRVLAIQPGIFGDPLISNLHAADMLYDRGVLIHGTKQRIVYNALSYCWGDGIACRLLQCNGQLYPVTRSAYQALQRLRKNTDVLYIWIDAICINQHDLGEKAIQIGKMVTIYMKANVVQVWLGEPQKEGSMIARLIIGFQGD